MSAAASVADAFGVLEEEFEEANPGVDVVLNIAGSSTLRAQILEGAPVDVFASADRSNMDQVVAAGESSGEPRVVASNSMGIVVPAGNPADIDGLDDLSDGALLVGLCAEGVPCGDLARQVLAKAGVAPSIDTDEPDVRSLVGKVAARELDAAIAYVSDVVSATDEVEGVTIPDRFNVQTEYPIVALRGDGDRATARAFIDFVLSPRGQEIVVEFGFESP